MNIDVFADIVCPWCWVGERHLAQAIELWRDENPDAPEPVVRFLPFELNPDMPSEGMDRTEYLDRKFGPGGVGERYAQVEAAGREAGIDFRFPEIERMPNTLAAHQLVQGVIGEPTLQMALVEALMRAFFTEARDLSDRAVLIDVARSVGIAPELAEAMLADPEIKARTTAIERQAREIGVEGVPFFIFNRKLAASGAQPPAVLADAMRQAQG
ncbi:MAG: DsbA family oxidoreductase [Burkholderiaceae bacterium]